MSDKQNLPLGIVIMLLGSLLITVNNAIVKNLIATYPLGQLLFIRSVMAALVLWICLRVQKDWRQLRPSSYTHTIVLSILAAISLYAFTYSLRFVPLASAVVLAYLSPVLVVALSPFVLRERVTVVHWFAVGVGFSGVLIMVAPDLELRSLALLLPIGVAAIIALRDLYTRKIIQGESVMMLSLMTQIVCALVALPVLASDWVPVAPWDWGLFVAAAVCVAAGATAMIAALRYGETSTLSPMKYSCVLWAAILGYFLWGETFQFTEWLGATMIVFGGIIIGCHQQILNGHTALWVRRRSS